MLMQGWTWAVKSHTMFYCFPYLCLHCRSRQFAAKVQEAIKQLQVVLEQVHEEEQQVRLGV